MSSPPYRDPDMVITLKYWRRPEGGVHVQRETALSSDLKALEDAMEQRHHDALNAMLRDLANRGAGIFLLSSDLRELEAGIAGGAQ